MGDPSLPAEHAAAAGPPDPGGKGPVGTVRRVRRRALPLATAGGRGRAASEGSTSPPLSFVPRPRAATPLLLARETLSEPDVVCHPPLSPQTCGFGDPAMGQISGERIVPTDSRCQPPAPTTGHHSSEGGPAAPLPQALSFPHMSASPHPAHPPSHRGPSLREDLEPPAPPWVGRSRRTAPHRLSS